MAEKLLLFGKIEVIPSIIYEVLISTCNSKDLGDLKYPYNIAPMGIEFKNDKIFYLRPYKTTQTYKNLLINEYFGLNMSKNVLMFYNSIFSKEKFTKDLFIINNDTDTPLLRDSTASMTCKTISEKSLSNNRAQFECELLSIQFWNDIFEPPCRARNLVLESLIHFTRLEVIKDSKKRDFLMNQIFEYQDIIKRTAKNTIFDNIMSKIIKKVKNI